MFKKRNTSNKQVNLDSIITDINTSAAAEPAMQTLLNQGKDINKNIGALYQEDEQINTESQKEREEKERETQRREIQQCFSEFVKIHKEKQMANTDKQKDSNQNSSENDGRMIDEQQYEPFNHQKYSEFNQDKNDQYQQQMNQEKEQKPAKMVNEIVIEDESGEQIQVRQDYGEISPEGSDSEDYQDGFQDQILKKTLSRQSYVQISKQLSSSHNEIKKNKFLKEIQKLSFSKVSRRIQSDLQKKQERKKQLESEVKYIERNIESRSKQLKQKADTKIRLQSQIDKVQRVLQALYYFGSEIENFQQSEIMKMVEEQEWIQKINKVRTYIKVNKQKFEQNRLKKSNEEQNEDEKSQGDVEIIPKRKIEHKWSQDYDQQKAINVDEDNDIFIN